MPQAVSKEPADHAGFAVVTKLTWAGGAQPFRQCLKELPGDGAIPFNQRAELPEGEPVANQIRRSGDRGRAGAAVDQGELAEVIARAEGGDLDAFARHR